MKHIGARSRLEQKTPRPRDCGRSLKLILIRRSAIRCLSGPLFRTNEKFAPQYIEITGQYDSRRREAIRQICRELSPDNIGRLGFGGEGIDTLTSGFWQKMHMLPENQTRAASRDCTMQVMQAHYPESRTVFLKRRQECVSVCGALRGAFPKARGPF